MTHVRSARASCSTRYTRDISREDLQRLFTHDTRDAYRFFTRGLDEDQFARAAAVEARAAARVRQIFLAFTLRLSPARRALYLGGAGHRAHRRSSGSSADSASVDIPFGLPFFQIAVLAPQSGPTAPSRSSSACSWSTCSCCWKSPTGCR